MNRNHPSNKHCLARLIRIGTPTPLAILFVALLTILVLLFLNAAAPKPEEHFLLHNKDLDLTGAPQDHPDLIAYIKQLHIKPPVGKDYNLKRPDIIEPSQNGQAKVVENLFNGKRKGTFLEAGAYDGEELSNTLYLEKELDWRGILVEPDPWNYWALKKRSRKADTIHACLSPYPYPREVAFKQSDTMGHIVNSTEAAKGNGIFTRVKCFPLFSLLLAANLTTLDFLSLDVEGKELEVLKTLNWNEVDIKVICVEFKHLPEGAPALKQFLEDKNYKLNLTIGDDFIFVKMPNVDQIL